jgi:hypothetical protein
MWLTIVEGQVAQEHWADFERVFAAEPRPAALRQTYLLQSASDPTVWQTIGVWASREEFEAYRQSVAVPGALAMFRAVGAEPVVRAYGVKDHYSAAGA